MSVARSNPPEDGDAQGVCNYSGEEIEKLLAGGALERIGMGSAYNALADALARYAVRFYDPPNVLAQRLADGTFRLRIMDFEPASRLFFLIDAIPAIARLKVRRRFARHLKNWGLSPEGAVA